MGIGMIMGMNDDSGNLTPPSTQQSSNNRRKRMLFTGGRDFPEDALHICPHCKRIQDRHGQWHHVDRRMILLNEIKLIQDVCDQCQSKA